MITHGRRTILGVSLCSLLIGGCEGWIHPLEEPMVNAAPDEACEDCTGESHLHRLTRAEYAGALAAVFGDDALSAVDLAQLPPDGRVGSFASGSRFAADTSTVWAYRDVAERASPALAEVSGCSERNCAEVYVRRMGGSLFGETLSDEVVSAYLTLFDEQPDATTGMRQVISALLQAPLFLYRVEVGEPSDQVDTVKLTGREVATRLSYLLWRQPPDEELLRAAESGQLDGERGVAFHAERMLSDERSSTMVRHFFEGYLGLGSVLARRQSEDEFPEGSRLREDMRLETQTFGIELFRDGGTLHELFTADFSYASDELAAFYGVSPGREVGAGLPRIQLGTVARRGVLTHAAFIAAHTPEQSSAAVHRGKHLRENLFCGSIPPPPPIDTIITPDPAISPRQRLEQKTEGSGCIACHRMMNPLGFLLEHYDAEGAYRTHDRGFDVDSSGNAAGTDITGPLADIVALSERLAASEQVQDCFVRQWLRFAMARPETIQDAPSIALVHEALIRSGGEIQALVVALVSSPSFRYRRIPAEP